MKINILGTEYTVRFETKKENAAFNEDSNLTGYVDVTSKEIKILSNSEYESNSRSLDKPKEFQNKTLRHEIIHAFLYESGMTDWYLNEKLVEYLAIMLPKINVALEKMKMESD